MIGIRRHLLKLPLDAIESGIAGMSISPPFHRLLSIEIPSWHCKVPSDCLWQKISMAALVFLFLIGTAPSPVVASVISSYDLSEQNERQNETSSTVHSYHSGHPSLRGSFPRADFFQVHIDPHPFHTFKRFAL